MDITPLTIIVGIAFLSLTASAQIHRPDLSKYFNPAALPGFSVPSDVTAPKVTEPRFIILALTVAAQARESRMLSQHIAALSKVGFLGMAEIKVPSVDEPRFVIVAEQSDQTIKEALAILSKENQVKTEISGEIVRKLVGADLFSGEKLEAQGRDVDRSDPNKPRYFSVANFRGRIEIFLGQVYKNKNRLRTYLTTTDGTLVAATETRKINNKLDVVRLSNSEVEEDFKAELAFWKDYYLTRIKVAKST